MKLKRITANVYEIPLGNVNAFLIEDEELTLIDTGTPGSAVKVLHAIRSIGRDPGDLRHILLTHSHPDHAGGAAELKAQTNAKIYMHEAEADNVRNGFTPKPDVPVFTGFINKMMYNLFIKNASGDIAAATVDELIDDGDWLPVAGGIHTIHVPGHSAGQLAFFLPGQKNVLFAADTAANIIGLGYAIFYEDFQQAKHSLEKLATFDFDVACFGHGGTIRHSAATRFRNKFMKHAQKISKQTQYIVLDEESVIRIKEPEERI